MEDTVWRVGCYKINPTTPRGQKFFILHMLVLPLIPITALVFPNSVTMNTLLGYQSRVSTIRRQVRGGMEIALFIQNIQEERAEVALYIFTKQSDAKFNTTAKQTKKKRQTKNETSFNFIFTCSISIQERFSQTDRALEAVPTWPNVSRYMIINYITLHYISAGKSSDQLQVDEGQHSWSRWLRGLQI